MSSYCPRYRVTLQRWDSVGVLGAPEDISRHVIALETHKAYGHPVGKFRLTIPYVAILDGQHYSQAVKPHDVILIECDGGYGAGFTPVMRGLVDECKRVKQIQQPSGQPHRFVQVEGSDFGKLLVRHHCQYYLALSPTNIGSPTSLTQAVYGAQLYAGGNPATIAKAIVEGELHKQMPWTREFVVTDRIQTKDFWWLSQVLLSKQETVWQALYEVANEPYNKLSADTLETGKFGIILEECPFDGQGKLDLPYPRTLHILDIGDVITEEIGTNDLDRITYLYQFVECGGYSEPSGQNLLFLFGDAVQPLPSVGRDLVNQFGFMSYTPRSRFVPFPPPGNGRLVNPQLADYEESTTARTPVQDRTKLFWEWYKNNASYESGLLTVHGRPDIRCGDGVLYKENNYQYYVEQVAHKWVIGEQPLCVTTLHVTRGQPNNA